MTLDTWHELWAILSRNKLRTLMTASGVFWGMFMLVMMLGFGNGLERGVAATMDGYATNAVYVWIRVRSMPFRGMRQGASPIGKPSDVPWLMERVKGAEVITGRTQIGGYQGGEAVRFDEETGFFTVSGDMPDYNKIQPLKMKAGRWLNERDMAGRTRIAVIGDVVREQLFADEPALGRTIFIRDIGFQVVGVFESYKGGEMGDKQESVVHIPLATLNASFTEYAQNLGWLAILGKPNVEGEVLAKQVKAAWGERLIVHPDDPRAFGHWSTQEEFSKIKKLFGAIEFVVWFVGAATLLSGVVGVSNILLITVRERTSEIGLRRALGATRSQVIFMILQEAFLLTSIAGYAGLVFGVVVLELLSSMIVEGEGPMGPPDISLQSALVAVAVLVVGGVFAGLIPAQRAANIHPVEALRS